MKIKNKLILFAFLTSILPLIGLALIAFESSSSTINRLVSAELTTVSTEKLQQIEGFFSDAAVDLQTWSRLLIMQDVLTDDEEGDLGSELRRLLEQYSYFADLLVINDAGKVIAGKAEQYDEGLHAAVTQQLTETVLRGERYQGRVQLLGEAKTPVLIMATPIRADYDADTMIGGLIGIIDWTQIQKRLAQVQIAGVMQDSDHRLILTSGSDLLYATGSGVGGLSGAAPVTLPTQAGIAEVSSDNAAFLIGTSDTKGSDTFTNPGWRLHVLLSTEVAFESVAALGQRFLVVGIFVLLLGGVAGAFLARSIITPIHRASYRMHDIAQGDGDLTEYLDERGRDETSQLAGSFNIFLKKLKQIITDIIDNSRQMNQSAFQVAAISDEIANIDREQMADSQEVSNAADKLLEIAQSVQVLAEESRVAVATTDEESQAGHAKVEANISEMQQTVTEVDQAARDIAELSDASQRIHAIIDTISTIAEQTNLLALNAAIEAARAGEQGRGFAVVADEVRSLASRTAESTVEISTIVNDLTGKVDGTVAIMEGLVERAGVSMSRAQETAQAFDAISNGVQAANDVSHRITAAAGTQMEQLEIMRVKLQQLFATLQQSTDKAHTTSLVSNDLYQISERITSMLQRFNVGDSSDHEFHRANNEKRDVPRLEAFLLANVKQGALEMDGVTRDISLSGMQLEVDEPLDKAAPLNIGLFIPKEQLKEFTNQNPLNLTGRIVRHFEQDGKHNYGIEYENIDELKRNGIEKVFAFFHTDPKFVNGT